LIHRERLTLGAPIQQKQKTDKNMKKRNIEFTKALNAFEGACKLHCNRAANGVATRGAVNYVKAQVFPYFLITVNHSPKLWVSKNGFADDIKMVQNWAAHAVRFAS
tara:strand:+ start:54 stop:371 length:318 start_codon:yes stop_codon:yes gene_type:complete